MKVKVNTAKAERALREAPVQLESEFYAMFQRWGHRQRLNMRTNMRSGGALSVTARSGLLGRSIQVIVPRVRGRLDALKLRTFFAGNAYARIQEEGGVVRPRLRKFLAIPMDFVKTAAGVARYASPRNYPGKTFVWRHPLGLFIAERVGKGKRATIRLLWRLVRQVRLRPKLGWFRTWRAAEMQRQREIQGAAHRALEKAVGRPA